MRRNTFLRASGAAAAIGVLGVVAAAGPAGALDDAKPAACTRMAFTDPPGDNKSTAVATPAVGTDGLGGFLKHDPAKGPRAIRRRPST
jgi:hypothetical protein